MFIKMFSGAIAMITYACFLPFLYVSFTFNFKCILSNGHFSEQVVCFAGGVVDLDHTADVQ